MNNQEFNINNLSEEEIELIKSKRAEEKTEEQKKQEEIDAWFDKQIENHDRRNKEAEERFNFKLEQFENCDLAVRGENWDASSEWVDKEVELEYESDYNTNTRKYDTKIKRTFVVRVFNCNIHIKYKRFAEWTDEKLRNQMSTPELNWRPGSGKPKFISYSITESSRGYTLRGLLKKAAEITENAEMQFENYNKTQSIQGKTVEKYSKLYPNAEVTPDTYTVRYGGPRGREYKTYEAVKITFKSGSFIVLGLGNEMDKEYIKSKVDAVVNSLKSPVDLADYFNNQTK